MSLKSPKEVQEIAVALDSLTQSEFYRKYDGIDAVKYGCPRVSRIRGNG